ncbi:MAG: hypothetical protein AB1640_11430 [bacterium]
MTHSSKDRTWKCGTSPRLGAWLFLVSAGLALAVSSGCGDPNDALSEDMEPVPQVQVVLTEQSHPEGWGLSECLLCHPVFQIHWSTSDPAVDLEEIRETVDRLGPSSCALCHGANGAGG